MQWYPEFSQEKNVYQTFTEKQELILISYIVGEIKLKEVDYTMFSYIIAGFDLTAISRLLGMSLNNVYAHKRRIRIKIEEKQPLHASQYLEMMS